MKKPDATAQYRRRLNVLEYRCRLQAHVDGDKLGQWIWQRIPCWTSWNPETREFAFGTRYWEGLPIAQRLIRISTEPTLYVNAA